jgi:hypothetical protein
MSLQSERSEQLIRRQRRIILTLIRENHESQNSRYTGSEIWGMMLKIRQTVGKFQVNTMLQDLQALGYIDFRSQHDEDTGTLLITEIVLTAEGLRFWTRHKSNEDVLFD